jgi:hypothetical protein
MELMVPVAEKPKEAMALAPRADDLGAAAVGFIDNGWWSMGVLFEEFETLLAEQHGVARIIRKSKPKSSPVARQDLDELGRECGAVITALGN